MNDRLTPRRAIKSLLRGEVPSRPLLMPIMFGIGARIQNLSLRDFCGNPTKIASALRQIRSVFRVDGVSCYFDPCLEAEALGCKLNWNADGSSALLASGAPTEVLPSPYAIAQHARVRLACDVLQRLKVMLSDEPALMVRVTGPFTLADQLAGVVCEAEGSSKRLSPALVEFSAQVAESLSKEFVEAGADVVFLVEDHLPDSSPETWQRLSSLMEPVINMIRFYEALPVLLLNDSPRVAEGAAAMLNCHWDGVFCPVADPASSVFGRTREALQGLALPPHLFEQNPADVVQFIRSGCGLDLNHPPVLVTSSADISPAADPTKVAEALSSVRSAFSVSAGDAG